MHYDGRTEFFIALGVSEEWMARIDKAASECPEVKLVADFDVWGRNTHFGVEMTEYQREVLAVLGRYFLNNHPLQAGRILMAVTEQDVPHSDGAMP